MILPVIGVAIALPALRETVDLIELVKAAVAQFSVQADARRIDRGADIAVMPPNACEVLGDTDQLRVMLNNLIDNALRYTPRGGTVDVRLHAGARADASTHAVGASAYTVGSDLVFAAGQYAPQTREGQRLLAHELTHTIQQRAGAANGSGAGTVGITGRGAGTTLARSGSAKGGSGVCCTGRC